MTDMGKRLKQLRTDRGLTQDEVSNSLGVSKPTIFKYGSGIITNIPSDRIEDLANLYDVSPAYIMGWTDDQDYVNHYCDLKMKYSTPIVGDIAAGTPILAEENITDRILTDPEMSADFVLRVKGDSMIDAGIHDGDLAFIRKQETLENGEIGAIRIGNEATLKRFRKTKEAVILEPANEDYDPIVLTSKDEEVRIEGKLVGVYSKRQK